MENRFNKKEFKELFKCGDLNALLYLKDTVIEDMKEKIKEHNKTNSMKFIREEYICSLFYAVLELNNCIVIHEREEFENKFDFDTYAIVRDKLFEELGLLKEIRK